MPRHFVGDLRIDLEIRAETAGEAHAILVALAARAADSQPGDNAAIVAVSVPDPHELREAGPDGD